MNAATAKPIQILDFIDLDSLKTFSANDELISQEHEAYNMFRQSVDDIKIIRAAFICVTATSMGKDSTITMLCALQAHLELIAEGKIPQDAPYIVTTINTLVENHLMTILVAHQLDILRDFGKAHNLNIDIRVGQPPLTKQWAPMYLSGLKVLSLAQMNNDCSETMKVDTAAVIEKKISDKYGENVVTLLGSRVSESSRRKRSLESRNQHNKRPEDLIEFADTNRTERVFAPIVNMLDEHVWILLKRAGTQPLVKPSAGLDPIPSYAKNHMLLDIIYRDATDGSCPVSTKSIQGAKTSTGGCGKSARTGCYTCLKPVFDRSAAIQAKSDRHGVINRSMLSVRDYMMNIGMSISHRTWHTRAIDSTTGGIACQPNVLNAETLDNLIIWLCQVTVDERIRAKEFARLVACGDEMLDLGYSDIFKANDLSEDEKTEFAAVYLKYATSPLIEPMTKDIAIYLSAIHSRDGIKLPNFRAIFHWKTLVEDFEDEVNELIYPEWDYQLGAYNNNYKTYSQAAKIARYNFEESGIRKPYPTVPPSSGQKDSIPDAVMIIPPYKLSEMDYMPHTGGNDAESVDGCLVQSHLPTTKIPFKLAKRMFSTDALKNHQDLKGSDKIEISGFDQNNTLSSYFRDSAKTKKVKHKFSTRKVKKVSRAKGGYKVLERGRTSIDKPSFGLRTEHISLDDQIVTHTPLIRPNLGKIYTPLLSIDDECTYSYEVSFEGLMNFEDYGGMDRAIAEHDAFIERAKNRNTHIYFFGGTEAFEQLMRFGVLDLNDTAKRNTMMILKRTQYFSSLGLFRLDDKSLVEFVTAKDGGQSVVQGNIIDTTTACSITSENVMTMFDHRSYKAKLLLDIRSKRNINRRYLKADFTDYSSDPVMHTINNLRSSFFVLENRIIDDSYKISEITFMLTHGLYNGDDQANSRLNSIKSCMKLLHSYTYELDYLLELTPKSIRNEVKDNVNNRALIESLRSELNDMFVNCVKKGSGNFIKAVIHSDCDKHSTMFFKNVSGLSIECITEILNIFPVSHKITPQFTLSDSPALSTTDIEW
jgi:3'-phosphoadenosine 5'-phosphosulfate sulfotransferase (PAPS reductase)/FAD synthetase